MERSYNWPLRAPGQPNASWRPHDIYSDLRIQNSLWTTARSNSQVNLSSGNELLRRPCVQISVRWRLLPAADRDESTKRCALMKGAGDEPTYVQCSVCVCMYKQMQCSRLEDIVNHQRPEQTPPDRRYAMKGSLSPTCGC
jgi:hypothetical protein